jgi:exosortase/archaeosortase family protein
MNQKRTFKILIVLLVIMLTLLPFVTTFNSALTGVVNKLGLYKTMQSTLVPFESKIIVGTVRVFHIPAFLAGGGEVESFYLLKGTEYYPVQIQWNCLGWQSILLLAISFVFGLEGNFTKSSKLECVLIGILGTFLVNVFRMIFIVVGVYFYSTVFALLIHDYFAAFVTIIWLIFFWYFSYAYVLQSK